jgi:hypothetical protein
LVIQNDECVAWQAVHEFGHALGFKHEHERLDGPGCTGWDQIGDAQILTEYDEDSTMNYCSDDGNNEGSLSRLDIVGVQVAYGRKPWGTIIGPGGRCVGTFQLEANLKLCLDDPSGGKTNNTELVLADCTQRATKRWDFLYPELVTMGEYALDWYRGVSVTSLDNRTIEYTDHGLLLIGDTGKCAIAPTTINLQLQEWDCHPDWPEQQFFLAKSGQVWNIARGQVTCLEVDDDDYDKRHGQTHPELTGVSSGTPIRVQKCDANRLQQKFNLIGFLRGANNRVIGIDGTHFISFNGLALRSGSFDVDDNSIDFRYYFGRTDVLGLD